MKIKVLIAALILAGLAVLFVRLIQPTSQTEAQKSTTETLAEAPDPTDNATAENQTAPIEQSQTDNAHGNQGNWMTEPLPPGRNLQEQLEELARRRGVPLNSLTQQAILELSNTLGQLTRKVNQPMEFYGKVVDESGLPLEGATASITCLIYPEKSFETNVLTDTKGFFLVHNLVGQGLTVLVHRNGYEEKPNANENSFLYHGVAKGFRPDPNNPVVFYLRARAEKN